MSGVVGDNVYRASGVVAAASASAGGGLLQIKQTVKTDIFSTTSATFAEITDLNVVITPTASDSKILVSGSFLATGTAGNLYSAFTLYRDIGGAGYAELTDFIGDAEGSNRTRCLMSLGQSGTDGTAKIGSESYEVLDNPATTSEVTYKLYTRWCQYGDGIAINYNYSNGDQVYSCRGSSQITAKEISADVL